MRLRPIPFQDTVTKQPEIVTTRDMYEILQELLTLVTELYIKVVEEGE